jgi:hypothetical protein
MFGPLQLSPASGHAEHDHSYPEPAEHPSRQPHARRSRAPIQATVEGQGPVVVIRQDLSDVWRVEGSEARTARLHEWAENSLAPMFTDNSWLRLSNADLIIVYDPDAAAAVWAYHGTAHRPLWRITIRPDHQGHETTRIAIIADDR